MSELLASPFFGIALSILAFWVGVRIQKKTGLVVCNPLLIGIVLVVGVLLLFRIPYESYHQGGEIINGRLCYRPEERVLLVDGEPVKLTATELKIVDLLMRNLGRVFPAEEIYRRVWNEEAYATENTVMVHIRRIREKIELNPKEPEYLKVVWGIGYKIEKR